MGVLILAPLFTKVVWPLYFTKVVWPLYFLYFPLEQQQGHHDPDRNRRAADRRVQAAKLGFQLLPWEALGQFHQLVIRIQHHLQGRCPHGLLLFGWEFAEHGGLDAIDQIPGVNGQNLVDSVHRL